MANGTQLQQLRNWLELKNAGAQNPEGVQDVPANYRIPPARIYVVNHSRTLPWKRVKIAVSAQRGAEEALIYDKELAKVYNVDTLIRAVERGRDMNRYETSIKPIVYSFSVGRTVYGIPPSRTAESECPKVEVKEGAWDLFLGNYDRMNSPDITVSGDEKSRLAIRWKYRYNPVKSFTDDGVTTDLGNPHGFLEFIRETTKPAEELFDKEYLSALDFMSA
jgi:hypothetical protein